VANDLPVPQFGHHLVEELSSDDLGRHVIYSQQVPWKFYGNRFAAEPARTVLVDEVSLESLDALLKDPADFDTVVAFGGGLAIDSAKFVAWKTGKRLLTIPTAVSADVSVCRAIAVRDDWRVRYIGDKMPERLIVDYDIIRSAPAYLNRGGVCDILSCYTALKDWEISSANTAETTDTQTVDATNNLLRHLFSHQKEIHDVTEDGIRFLIEGYLEEVHVCEQYGSPRPEEGSEHFFAYNLEYRLRRPFLHGTIISLGVVLMTILQERDPREVADFLDGTGVLWRPKDAGLRDEDIVQSIETLDDYCRNEGFYYTVVDERKPDEQAASMLLDTIANL
jgi:glycerol dehydrogenase-like iron-containing ADH family enzyme